MASTRPLRFLLYSHDGLGLGHVRRNLAIATALVRAAPGSSVLLVTGAGAVAWLDLERGVDVLRLPALRKLGNGRYAARRLRLPGTDLRELRAGQISAAVRSFRPDLMLVDKHPTGASGELLAALRALHEVGGLAVLGFRDILDEPGEVRREWQRAGTLKLIRSHYDAVLVYGMPAILDVEAAYGLRSGRKCEVRYTGYVVHMGPSRDDCVESTPPLLLAPRRCPVVLASAGGGEDGGRLLETFIETARGAPWQGMAVAGPDMPRNQRHALRRAAARAGVDFRVFAHDLASWLRESDAAVCMGGYNTLAETLFRGTPTVCVPRVQPRSEQLIRARAFERLRLLQVLEPSCLDTSSLGDAVATALASSRALLARRAVRVLDFHGAWRAAEALLRLADPVELEAPAPEAADHAIPLRAL
jgi:predicted glycosyltransferase